MKIQIKKPFLNLLLLSTFSTVTFAGDIDREWEAQIAQKLVENTEIGEAVWLKTGDNQFLALFTEHSAYIAQGAAIILHGMGAHPDWPEVIAPIRTSLAEQGWSTLSIQLPVLAPETPVAGYGETVKEVGQRIGAAVQLLRDKNFLNIVIIGHSFGAAAAAKYLAEEKEQRIHAFVSIGIRSQKFLNPKLDLMQEIEKIKIPVLDIYGSRDFDSVVRSAADRRLAARKSGNRVYRQIEIEGADHYFIGLESLLVKRIRGWLEKASPGVAVMVDDDIKKEIGQDVPDAGAETETETE
jgi:pimeloyl-ACP methyl ester carboxylesterase